MISFLEPICISVCWRSSSQYWYHSSYSPVFPGRKWSPKCCSKSIVSFAQLRIDVLTFLFLTRRAGPERVSGVVAGHQLSLLSSALTLFSLSHQQSQRELPSQWWGDLPTSPSLYFLSVFIRRPARPPPAFPVKAIVNYLTFQTQSCLSANLQNSTLAGRQTQEIQFDHQVR